MDTVTHFALGGTLAALALGRRTGPWRAVLWGGLVGTLPDLDVLVDHGDAVLDMIRHRAETHALCWLSLAAPAIALGVAALLGELRHFGRWWLALWLALVAHALLDAMTIYGTRLLLPFDATPYGLGSLFVIDPLFTLPLLVGVAGLLTGRGGARGRRWLCFGLATSLAYAGWSIAAQQHALGLARRSLAAQGVGAERVLATAAPLQTFLWRIVATTPEELFEAHWSVFDGDAPLQWTHVDRGASYLAALRDHPAVAELDAFSHGFWKMWRDGDEVRMADVRMGMEPHYVFTFVVGHIGSPVRATAPTVRVGARLDVARALPWLWRRMWGEPLPPPR